MAAEKRLRDVSDTPMLDAELLLAEALGVTRERLILGSGLSAIPASFEGLLERREAGEPLAYILGMRAFWTIELEVGPGVLIPRPDTETLLDAAVAHFKGGDGPKTILDLGTGPGSLLLAALDEWPDAKGVGVDASPTALDYARRNADRLDMSDRVVLKQGDWGAGLSVRFDLILCNPPYIADEDDEVAADVRAHEPTEALFAGADGLDDYRRIVPQLPALMAEDGLAVIEIGYRQADAVFALIEQAGLKASLHRDLAGRDRALAVRR
ncbi:peptide chain release factor N(5)-glutamine methyltransferase [Sphingomicrobium sediminis]|uniref:Release factor glutamine methyltransferase n=1 Tax=Sphingomicrobium sediminis TaxID=2950949 RepID=A0A9X2J4B3_9SPHN|nr:peptide chain release factor N(5)-glutamine methyltransferase [Sphingomicrobium sediminis]MCM8558191.1 peptide chain release factor N(5)-glutamine methyltransferase [Sphingomicrobium sediminis]